MRTDPASTSACLVDAPLTDAATTDTVTADAPPAARPRRTSTVRLAVTFALGAAAALFVVLLAPLAVGGHAAVVASGSMSPALRTGDVVVVLPVAPRDAALGEVVVFSDPGRGGRPVSHRLVDRRPDGDGWAMTTRGDANTGSESWRVAADEQIGRVVLRVPLLGRVVSSVPGQVLGLPVVLAPAALLLLVELVSIWRPSAQEAA